MLAFDQHFFNACMALVCYSNLITLNKFSVKSEIILSVLYILKLFFATSAV